jgi:hypothetical protein
MGGSNEPSNLVILTISDHAEAHRILWETHKKMEDYYAWQGLLGNITGYEILKGIMVSEKMRNHLSKKGKEYWNSLTEEEKNKKKEKFNSIKFGNKNALGKTWTLSEKSKNNIAESKSVNWLITYPNGKKEIIKNMNKFCKTNGLDQGAMSNVAKKLKSHHKGYFCERLVD